MSQIVHEALLSFLETCPVTIGETVGVAVSGGADSMSLVLSLADIAKERLFFVKAVTVDHRLRPESAAEADGVAEVMRRACIPHTILVWEGDKPETRVEESAREKRYELMFNWCRQEKITKLFTAHHNGDQAETFWQRLARGSGVDGLSAIAGVRRQDGIDLCRPLLSVSKADLQQDLTARGVSWVEDGMNEDEAYERVRWRNRQSTLSDMGLTPEVVSRSAMRLGRAREALDFYTRRFLLSLVEITSRGYVVISVTSFKGLPAEIRIRVLNRVLMFVGGGEVISLEALERYVSTFPTRMTLGGCLLVRRKEDLFIVQEAARTVPAADIPARQQTEWGRFRVWAACPVHISAGVTQGDEDLPKAVRDAVPNISSDYPIEVYFIWPTEKEFEKLHQRDYSKEKAYPVYIRMKEAHKG